MTLAGISTAVKAITNLLMLELRTIRDSSGKYKSPYLQTLVHPYVAILRNRIDAWNDILYHIVDITSKAKNETNAREIVAMLWPFVSQALTNSASFSNSSSAIQQLSHNLHSQLIDIARVSDLAREPILSGLATLIPSYQIVPRSNSLTNDNVAQLTFVLRAYNELIDSPLSEDVALQLLQSLLSFYCDLRTATIPIGPYFYLYRKLVLKAPILLLFQSAPLVLGWLLLGSSESEQNDILSILNSILDGLQALPEEFRPVLPFLIYPLLQIVPSTNTQLSDFASKLLKKVEMALTSTSSKKIKLPQSNSFAVRPINSNILAVFVEIEKYLMSCTSSKEAREWTPQYVSSIRDKLTVKEQITSVTKLFIAPFLLHSIPEVRLATTKVISRIAELAPLQGLTFLSLVLYQLKYETDPEIHLTLLSTLPTLATHQACVAPILRVLLPLTQNYALRPVALRLMAKLWELQPRTFPRIHSLLLEYTTELPVEVRVSMAASLRDIIFKKPERGTELIAILSRIITHDPHATPVAIGIDTLDKLCQEDILEFKTAWGVIAKSLSQDLRSVVQMHLAQFFANGSASAASEDDAEKSFVENIVGKLWNLTKSQSPGVRREAYKSLVAYAERNIESLGAISPASYAQILTEPDEDARKECEKIVYLVLKFEVHHHRRRGMALGVTSLPTSATPAVTFINSLPDYIRGSYENGTLKPSLLSGVAAAVLWSFRPPPLPKDVSKLVQVPRRYVVSKAQYYRRGLNDMIADISSRAEQDWIIRYLTIPMWINFMRDCTEACIQGEISQASMNGEEIEEQTAVDRALAYLLKDLRAKCDETPKLAENAAIAIGCLGLALPPLAYSHIEKISDTLKDLLAHGPHEWVQYGSAIGLGIVAHALHSTDLTRLTVSLLSKQLKNNENEWVKMGCATALGFCSSSIYKQEETAGTKKHDTEDARKALLMQIISTLKAPFENTKLSSEAKWGTLGCAVGLAQSASALELTTDFKTMKDLYTLLLRQLQVIRPQDGSPESCAWMGACLEVPSILCRLFRLEQVTQQDINSVIEILSVLLDSTVGLPAHSAACIGFPSLIHGLLAEGYSFASDDFVEKSITRMLDITKNQQLSSRGGALVGITNFIGSNLISVDPRSYQPANPFLSAAVLKETKYNALLGKCTDTLKSIFENDTDPKVSRYAAWCLGSLARPLPPTAVSSTSAPNTNMPETNLLKFLFGILQENISKQSSDPTSPATILQIESIMRCISEITKLPSLRWETIIAGLMKSGFGTAVRRECVHFVINNISATSLLAMLDEWTERSRFVTLELELQQELYVSLPQLLSMFPASRAKKLLTETTSVLFTPKDTSPTQHETNRFVIRSLTSCLSVNSIQPAIMAEVHTLLLDLYDLLPSPTVSTNTTNPYQLDKTAVQLLDEMFDALKNLPSDLVHAKLSQVNTNQDPHSASKAIYVGSKLIEAGQQPVNLLSVYRTWIVSQKGEAADVAQGIMQVLINPIQKLKESTQQTERSKWLLDTLDTLSLCPNPMLAMHLVALSCLVWTATDTGLLLSQQNSFKTLDTSEITLHANLLPFIFPNLVKMSFVGVSDRIAKRLTFLLNGTTLPTSVHQLLSAIVANMKT